MNGPKNSAIVFDDNLLNGVDFDTSLDFEEEYIEDSEQDGDIQMFDYDDVVEEDKKVEWDSDTGEVDSSNSNNIVTEQTGADDYGVEVELSELGKDGGETYQVVKSNSFLGRNGDIVVMDNSTDGDYFKLIYVDIQKIAVVQRIRKNKNVESLVKSIMSTGLLQPVVVAPTATDGIYVLLNGYRRLIACAKAGITRIPCIVNTRITTPEIPILEALYNHYTPYSVREMVEYIEYLEKEKGILSASMIEYLLQMENGDYTKLKDLLNDNDEDILSKLYAGQITISQAFKKLEQRRKNESREEKELKKAEKVYQNAEESGAEKIEGAGEKGDEGGVLSEEEIKSLAIMANDIDTDERSLSEMIEDGNKIEGFKPHKQTPGEREILDTALRKAVLARDENTCKCCGISGQEFVETFDVHHIMEVYLGGDDNINNLVTVCTVCHKLIHLYGRGCLYIRPIEQMSSKEQKRFKVIVKLGTVIRKGLALKGMKKEELKKLDKADTIGRTKPGTGQVAG